MAPQFEFHVDLVIVMDATTSMTPVLAAVKSAALGFHDQMKAALIAKGKHVDKMRVRVVVFRDLPYNRDISLAASRFFELPVESEELSAWVRAVTLEGNDTYPESGLAGLAVALHSPWTTGGHKRRHVVVLWTDDDAHLPEDEHRWVPAEFRDQVSSSLEELTEMWHSSQYSSASARRLVLFAPDTGVWPEIAESWEGVTWFPSQAGLGLSEMELKEIMSGIANSV